MRVASHPISLGAVALLCLTTLFPVLPASAASGRERVESVETPDEAPGGGALLAEGLAGSPDGRAPIPVKRTDIRALALGAAASVEVEQTFVNPYRRFPVLVA